MPSAKFDKEQSVSTIYSNGNLIIQDLFASNLHPFDSLKLKGINGSTEVTKLPGLYLIYQNDNLVYAGKAAIGLRGRLTTHVTKLNKADRINKDEIAFKFVDYPHDIAAMAEIMIIDKFKPPWNTSGFGSNTAGKGRKDQKISQWQTLYVTSKLEEYLLTQIENLKEI